MQLIATELTLKDLTLRPISPKDAEFLYQVYASTRQGEMDLLNWNRIQKETFLQMQFDAQHKFYMQNFQDATFQILMHQGKDIGRLYLEHREEEIRIIDIALLTEFRGQGIGTTCLKAILEFGQQTGLPVRIHVERSNPALRLYTRLGFQQIAENGIYFLMEKTPGDFNGGKHA